MKKVTLLACLCALFMAPSVVAQGSTEVTYAPDPDQGYLFNHFDDNWFITVEGGVGTLLKNNNDKRDFLDRFSPAAGLYVGKWFSPIVALRAGVNYLETKRLVSTPTAAGVLQDGIMIDGLYKSELYNLGFVGDAMINLTNWWCGYRPGRIYNATAYIGGGLYIPYGHDYTESGARDGYSQASSKFLSTRMGLINSFNISKQVQLSLDLRYQAFSQKIGLKSDLQAYIGVTYLFKKREWEAPVVPVCPEPENCDALRARLAAADGHIADLEAQLRNCLNRPVEVQEVSKAPLATIYYGIGSSRLSKEDNQVVAAIANVMKDNSNTKYVLTGWADNYTGTDELNQRLRQARVDGVQKALIKNGVPESQITTTTNNGSLSDLGEKFVALDRAVTIEEAK